jgi:AcrR family transcriptional regulator
VTKHQRSVSRKQLDRGEWIAAAIDTLADEGMAGLRVEALAKRCGVTKGSFYWHFKDRQDLIGAVMQVWQEGRIRDIDKQSEAAPGREREQLQRIIDVYGGSHHRKGIAIELAVRDWARRDAAAGAIVEAVDRHRLERARQLFVAGGLSESEATSRSLLLYAYVFGHSLMACGRGDAGVSEAEHWIAEHIVAGRPPLSA